MSIAHLNQSTLIDPGATAARDGAQRLRKLALIKLDAEHARDIARKLEAAGRGDEARGMLDALEAKGRVTLRLPPDEAFKAAQGLHRGGQAAVAERYYRSVLAADPTHARAHHFLGVLLHNTHRTAKAMPHLLKSLEQLSDAAWAWSNLGVVYRESGDYEKARDAYLKALALKEDYPEAHNNLGITYRWMRRWPESERHYRRALELNPDYVEAHINLGKLLYGLRKFTDAMLSFSRAITLYPAMASKARGMLARAHMMLDQREKAAEIYREWIEAEPDNPAPKHLLAACCDQAPDRAPDNYVADTFDSFAHSFDAKLADLGYRAPQLVAAALATAHDEKKSYGLLADAGCGTGLCAPLVRKRAKKLIGVDLSKGMLAKAEERGGYDALHEAELTAFFSGKTNAYDTIISADTLCYFGVLTDFAAAAFGALKPNGVLVFTVEALPDESDRPFRLQDHGRYAHRKSYIEEALTGAGFLMEAMRREDLRNENAQPVSGWLVTARKPSTSKH